MTLNNETPKYVNSENFVFDKETYQDYLERSRDSVGYDGDDWGVMMELEVIVVEEVGEG